MKEKEIIRSLFDRLRPAIIAKLLNPEDYYVRWGVAQLVVPFNAEEAKILSPEEQFTAHPSDFPNIWYVYPDEPINVPWKAWKTELIISLKTDDMREYGLTVSITSFGCADVISYGAVVTSGTIAQIALFVKDDKFLHSAGAAFKACLEAVATDIETPERDNRKVQTFADVDITDYDSVMRFVDSVNDNHLLRDKGQGLELFTYGSVKSLVNRRNKSIKLLVDRNGKAQFCTLGDFPNELLRQIRRKENRDWDLGVYNLSVGKFDSNGQAFVTWVISPYDYCPMDEDGFGEEEELEVAVTCHIDTEGRLADTPVWKPYTGPRR
ncbi:MAG: hypothetical protein ACI30N_06225 [Muribaculaceae bacterium]